MTAFWNYDLNRIHPARTIDFDALEWELAQLVAQDLVRRVDHDGASLYCYTRETVYTQQWSDMAMMCRGLIVDHEEKRVLATPFEKFFNLGEDRVTIPDLPFEVHEKLDGSLIIIFFHRGRWRTATKGSLNSEQAQWAQKKLDALDQEKFWHLMPGSTYLCEAVYPENKIVVKYDFEGLVLLGAYTEGGLEIAHRNLVLIASDMGWRVSNKADCNNLADLIAYTKDLPMHQEGFVLLFANGTRIKVKGEAYCRVHRMISQCTPLALWEAMLHGVDLREIRKELPEEFWPDFDRITSLIAVQVATFLHQVHTAAASVHDLSDKELGLSLRQRFKKPIADFVFPFRHRGNLIPPCDPSKKNPVPSIRRAVFSVFRPTGNKLPGYEPTSSINRVQQELSTL